MSSVFNKSFACMLLPWDHHHLNYSLFAASGSLSNLVTEMQLTVITYTYQNIQQYDGYIRRYAIFQMLKIP